ncbi:ribonuclease P protein subunit p38 [Perognathus longimembris pacificus]|uniref:ribonuclease P protein subunit p38 n=1 Tax=Perognathus longimembris pacificus TaxID=214514 RepID=UPI0020199FA9|nr:ribonuclease P protein subunit p38 [Perognathus longimembris pacificus]XP_048223721.1 ribonuclease P protein subunit p38 [Perognathus longimembris pacificus]
MAEAEAPQAPRRGSVRKARPLVVKTSLNNPYAICWSTLQREDMYFILQSIEDRFVSVGLQKVEDRKKRRKPSREGCSSGVDSGGPGKEKQPEAGQRVSGWSPLHIRRQLAIGVNEVTKALERGELLLVLVCKSVKPAIITSHLVQLSLSRDVPACQVPRLSERLAPVLGLKCLLALGFKKSTTDFAEQVEAILPRVPRLYVPWLLDRLGAAGDSDSSESHNEESLAASSPDPGKRKRKSEGREASGVALQPLKVKKLIPNPNKIRKPPKNKKPMSK